MYGWFGIGETVVRTPGASVTTDGLGFGLGLIVVLIPGLKVGPGFGVNVDPGGWYGGLCVVKGTG